MLHAEGAGHRGPVYCSAELCNSHLGNCRESQMDSVLCAYGVRLADPRWREALIAQHAISFCRVHGFDTGVSSTWHLHEHDCHDRLLQPGSGTDNHSGCRFRGCRAGTEPHRSGERRLRSAVYGECEGTLGWGCGVSHRGSGRDGDRRADGNDHGEHFGEHDPRCHCARLLSWLFSRNSDSADMCRDLRPSELHRCAVRAVLRILRRQLHGASARLLW
mmetsp:Transcript_128513/g.305008  ORF Transcript_128513/g.305008 Transcript_128513/m.305008 type:complete len:218 (-) Transcript_128513:592-1245(-)